jgi:Kinesin motor domain
MGSSSILEVSHANCIALSGRRFTYDAVFDAATTQADLYAQVSPPLLQAFLDGYNATVSICICWILPIFHCSAHA